MASTPLVSAVICTYNPNEYTLAWVLDCLAQQTLRAEDFEVIVIDNNSSTPLEAGCLNRGRPLHLRVVREPRQGQLLARCRGIMEAASSLLVFVDDDNGLAADYLQEAVRIAGEEPGLGAFGGSTRLLTDMSVAKWKLDLLPYLGVRDYGREAIISNRAEWGKWEPIGAGMVFRREVGLKFVETAERNSEARQLGRRGSSQIGGEDSLLARVACLNGYSCSYQPSLQLTHFIKGRRMEARALGKTIHGCARSWVINERICGRNPVEPSWVAVALELWRRYRYRVGQRGLKQGSLEWLWDVGYFQQVKASARQKVTSPGYPGRESAGAGV